MMTKEELLNTARKLTQPNQETVQEYGEKKNHLIAEVNRLIRERDDLIDLIGEDNEVMMLDNHANHALFMESMFKNYDAAVLVETVLWVFRAYRSHGFNRTYWSAQLNLWQNVIDCELSENATNEIKPFYEWMIVNIAIFTKLAEEEINQ